VYGRNFSYGPDRQYWKQESNYTDGAATTIYVGGLFEKVTAGGNIDFRHMISTGGSTIILSRTTAAPNVDNFYYVTTDHLGSNSVITNSAGAVLVNLSYDAFGQRRGANWTGSPSPGPSGDWGAIARTTRRGYTDHTMLDNLNLIQMNGRVQDPELGRFLSADPFIPHPMSTQSYNRYSYVRNNPLAWIDPSGFEDEYPDTCDTGALRCIGMWDGLKDCTGGGCLAWLMGQSGADGNQRAFAAAADAAKKYAFTAAEMTFPNTTTYLANERVDGTWLDDVNGAVEGAFNLMESLRASIFGRVGAMPSFEIKPQERRGAAIGELVTFAAPFARANLARAVPELAVVRGTSRLGGIISSTTNSAGGTVVTATGRVVGSDFAGAVNSGMLRGGPVNILSGAHGEASGLMRAERAFFEADRAAFGGLEG
jgi:RHS repeat-associated protein